MEAIIASALTIIMLLLKAWQDSKPARTEAARQQSIQQGRKDNAEINVDALAARIDAIRRNRMRNQTGDGLPIGRQPAPPCIERPSIPN
jgi:hypothetical protein